MPGSVITSNVSQLVLLMDPGGAGVIGPSAQRAAVEELKKETGAVPLLLQPMEEKIARGNLQSPGPATKKTVSQSKMEVC